jgi:hypothetical protein
MKLGFISAAKLVAHQLNKKTGFLVENRLRSMLLIISFFSALWGVLLLLPIHRW